MTKALIGAAIAAWSAAASATSTPVPEPETLGLLAAGAIAGLVAWIRRRR